MKMPTDSVRKTEDKGEMEEKNRDDVVEDYRGRIEKISSFLVESVLPTCDVPPGYNEAIMGLLRAVESLRQSDAVCFCIKLATFCKNPPADQETVIRQLQEEIARLQKEVERSKRFASTSDVFAGHPIDPPAPVAELVHPLTSFLGENQEDVIKQLRLQEARLQEEIVRLQAQVEQWKRGTEVISRRTDEQIRYLTKENNRLNQLLNQWEGYHHNTVREKDQEVQSLVDKNAKLQVALHSAGGDQAKISALQKGNTHLDAENKKLRSVVETYQKDYHELKQKYNKLKETNDLSEKEVDKIMLTVEKLNADLKEKERQAGFSKPVIPPLSLEEVSLPTPSVTPRTNTPRQQISLLSGLASGVSSVASMFSLAKPADVPEKEEEQNSEKSFDPDTTTLGNQSARSFDPEDGRLFNGLLDLFNQQNPTETYSDWYNSKNPKASSIKKNLERGQPLTIRNRLDILKFAEDPGYQRTQTGEEIMRLLGVKNQEELRSKAEKLAEELLPQE